MPGFAPSSDPLPPDVKEASWGDVTSKLMSFIKSVRQKKPVLYASLTDAHDFKTFLLRLPGLVGDTVTFESVVVRYPSLDLLASLETNRFGLVAGGELGLRTSLVSNCAELEQKAERLRLVESLSEHWHSRPWNRIPSFHCWMLFVRDGTKSGAGDGIATFGPWVFDSTTGYLTGGGHFITERRVGGSGGLVAHHDSTFMRLVHWFEGNDPIVRLA